MPDSAEQSQRRRGHIKDLHVLNYLREMIDYCRLDRRPEMQLEYEEVWRVAASKIYGPLPDRWRMSMLRRETQLAPKPPTPPPLTEWQQEVLQWPMRKIVDHYKKQVGGKFLVLECGHHQFATRLKSKYGPEEKARCSDCYKAEQALAKVPRKNPSSASTAKPRKAVQA